MGFVPIPTQKTLAKQYRCLLDKDFSSMQVGD